MPNQVYLEDGYYCSAHIPGPSHNFLGLKLESSSQDEPTITVRSGKFDPTGLDEARIIEAVQRGVASANSAHESTWHVVEIVYVSDDSPRYSIYESLAKTIVAAVNQDELVDRPENKPVNELYNK